MRTSLKATSLLLAAAFALVGTLVGTAPVGVPAAWAVRTPAAETPAVNTAPSYNGLALTPPMGFNNWAGSECNRYMNETLFTKTADDIVRLGLNKLGYDYANIDDC